jgi:hypothetical protein
MLFLHFVTAHSNMTFLIKRFARAKGAEDVRHTLVCRSLATSPVELSIAPTDDIDKLRKPDQVHHHLDYS